MKNQKERFVRINEQIRWSPVRVVKENQQLGVMPLDQAKRLAMEAGVDLVEIVPNVRPPVCSIMDYGKYKYEQSIKAKEQRKKSKSTEAKEITLSAKIAEHDIETKSRFVIKFLQEGRKVQLTLRMRNRELLHREEGFKVIAKVVERIDTLGKVVYGPKFEGKSIICKLEPKVIK